VANIIASAWFYASEHYDGEPRFENLELTSNEWEAERSYYFKVRFEMCGDDPRTVEVFVNLRGAVIRPEIRRFKSKKEYTRYARERGLSDDLPQAW
jgi:hypothetical protein